MQVLGDHTTVSQWLHHLGIGAVLLVCVLVHEYVHVCVCIDVCVHVCVSTGVSR